MGGREVESGRGGTGSAGEHGGGAGCKRRQHSGGAQAGDRSRVIKNICRCNFGHSSLELRVTRGSCVTNRARNLWRARWGRK